MALHHGQESIGAKRKLDEMGVRAGVCGFVFTLVNLGGARGSQPNCDRIMKSATCINFILRRMQGTNRLVFVVI